MILIVIDHLERLSLAYGLADAMFACQRTELSLCIVSSLSGTSDHPSVIFSGEESLDWLPTEFTGGGCVRFLVSTEAGTFLNNIRFVCYLHTVI